MKCPACGNELQEMTVGDLVVDVCKNGCGGIWFDNQEFKKVDERHESAGEALLDIPRDETIQVDQGAPRLCPKCDGVTMMKHFASSRRAVEIDECALCGGIWLDAGELRKIREQYATEDERKEAFRQSFGQMFDAEVAEKQQADAAELQKYRKFAHMFRFICPTYYIPGKQDGGAF